MLASRGMQTAFRLVTQSVSKGGRSIHIPVNIGRKPPSTANRSTARNVVKQARNILTRLIYGTTTGTANGAGNASRAFFRPIHLGSGIRTQLSLPARHMMSRPFGTQTLPKPPGVQRGITQVGLGTARDFSTARPIFQSLADNVPIAGRALYEMDLDVEKKRGKRIAKMKKGKENKGRRTKEKIRTNKKNAFDESFEQYFAAIPEAEMTTCLTVPLVPAGSSTNGQEGSDSASLIPIQAVSQSHADHTTHALRITSLFLRLDQAKVWQNGAHYEAFGVDGWDPGPNADSATCTVIRIYFKGWTEGMVREVIGEAGKGWCTLKEIRSTPLSAPISLESSRATTPGFDFIIDKEDDPHHEFIMPTLDFSSSFLGSHPATPFGDMTPAFELETGFSSPILENMSITPAGSSRGTSIFDEAEEIENEWRWATDDAYVSSESESEAGGGGSDSGWMGLGFSAEFMRRGQEMASNF